jgi:hypothetical protein
VSIDRQARIPDVIRWQRSPYGTQSLRLLRAFAVALKAFLIVQPSVVFAKARIPPAGVVTWRNFCRITRRCAVSSTNRLGHTVEDS